MASAEHLSITDFATWEPTLRLLREANAQTLDAPGGHVSGRIGRGSWSVPFRRGPSPRQLGRAVQVSDRRAEYDAVNRVRAVLREAGLEDIGFMAEISAAGHATLRLFTSPPGMTGDTGFGSYPGTLVRHEGALPEPARRLPAPNPSASPHESADLELLTRILIERFPGTTGATEEELAAAEARLGLPLPDELRALYRVMRELPEEAWTEDADSDEDGEWDEDGEDEDTISDAMFRELLYSLGDLRIGDASLRYPAWHLAREACITPPGAAVQQLAGSPGWIVFGNDHGNSYYAIDLTPGPGGHTGQVISLPYDEETEACLEARSLTDFVQNKITRDMTRRAERPVIALVNQGAVQGVEAAAHPGLEVLIVAWRGEPLSLAPVIGLPKLRTLIAYPGTLANPTEIAGLTGLEYLELGLEDWRILLDAKAVPDTLLAAKITVRGNPIPQPQPDPLVYNALANEILALWNAPRITETVIEEQLGPGDPGGQET
jgi:cell wall assembly regulator SMI1